MKTIKEVFALLAADGGWCAMNKKQMLAALYFVLCYLTLFSGNVIAIVVAGINMLNAIRLQKKYGVDKIVEE